MSKKKHASAKDADAVSLLDPALVEFCTVRQLEYAEAVQKHGSINKAAAALNVARSTMQASIKHLKRKAAAGGYSPDHDMTRTVPDGFLVKGVSSLYDKDGKLAAQWVKSSVDTQRQAELQKAALDAMCEEIPRINKLPVTDKAFAPNLCSCYVITDYHLSMLSHHEETGDDWDVKIAERTLLDWFTQAIAQAPDAETAVFAQLSDFLHADGIEPLTPASKHLLDVDSRFYKVVRAAIRLLRQIIDMLLVKHKTLHIIMADANHDPVSQIWLREWFSVLYENEPRVTVDRSPNPYNAFEFGLVALFFHHGHKRGVANVQDVFVAQYRELYGRTKHAYAHMGHLHHTHIKEHNTMIVEQHRTLAARDAYSARGGYLSGRDAKVITYHREFGEVSRLTISSDMVRGGQ